MKNCYQLLKISPGANDEDIKKAFRELAKKYHPDKNNNSEASQTLFDVLVEAKETLLDPVKRREHDLRFGFVKETPEPRFGKKEAPKPCFTKKETTDSGMGILAAGLVGILIGIAISGD